MGPVGKTLLPLALVLVLVGFIAGALVTAGTNDPPRRAPVEMVTAPGSESSGTPTSGPSSGKSRPTAPTSGVTVISPRPGVGDDGPDDDGDDGDDDGDDGDDDD